MSNTKLVKVTQEHIDKGIPSDSKKCAIALAINEAYDGKHDIVQAQDETEIDGEHYTQDEELSDWICEFDGQEEQEVIPQPCTIEVDDDRKHIRAVAVPEAEGYPEWHVSFSVIGSAHTTIQARTALEGPFEVFQRHYIEFRWNDLAWGHWHNQITKEGRNGKAHRRNKRRTC